MKRIPVLITVLFLLASCTPPKKHLRERYVNDTPELKSDVRKAILAGDVIVGMSKEEVYASWATPIIKGEKKENQTIYEYWTYPDMKDSPFVNLYFRDDIVVKIERLDEKPDID
jgi:hypothetical protein